MPVPSSLPSAHLSLTLADEGQVLLTVSSSQTHESKITPKRSSVYIVPVDARLKSSLAAALGKTTLTAEWLISKTFGQKPEEAGPTKIISEIQASLKKNNAQKAEQVFLKWLDSHSVRIPTLNAIFSLMAGTVKRSGPRS